MQLYAHIGFCKTGTKTLQNQVFPKLKTIDFYGDKDALACFYDLMFLDDLYYNEQKHIDFFNSASQNSHVLFSQEALTGFISFLGYSYRTKVAYRLQKIGFKKIIITIRNQKTVIESAYRQYIRKGGVLSFEKFFRNGNLFVENYFSLNQFEYWKLIQLYCSFFGKENVCILPLEHFTRNKKSYLKKIEIEESVYNSNPVHNKGISNLSLKIMRFSNHFTHSYFKPSNLISNKISSYKVQKILSKTIDPLAFKFSANKKSIISENNKEPIFQYYKDGNQKLNQYYHLNLKDYNYPL